eukprot:TRINITY_DN24693_c0_g1_i1.p1 TRINITY_DN24693_c0_g1~~TRINITY_DN24693_c0_g1_i1.p1  ORF type:complete len:320 (+),score=57.64 TRINITY_DN24693_c0_g1_i1:84-1043(+)
METERSKECMQEEVNNSTSTVDECGERRPVDPSSDERLEEAAVNQDVTDADGKPPLEAKVQDDGSYVLDLGDGSVRRWTRRPDGSWRKPERKRQGWVGSLEARKYVPKPVSTTHAADREGKHALHRPWRLWLRQLPPKGATKTAQGDAKWWDDQQLAHEFDTVEDFWCMTHFSSQPSSFENTDYSLFESGVTPAWEDPRFKHGGRWLLKLEKIKAKSLDDLWLLLSMALIGETFSDVCDDCVRGATVSLRNRVSKVAIWLDKAWDEDTVLAIGREFRRVFTDAPGLKALSSSLLEFEDFQKKEITLKLYQDPEIASGFQ